jgi:peptidoglycan/xylan/chitin deacetylase (PgdA/CDA1 family)
MKKIKFFFAVFMVAWLTFTLAIQPLEKNDLTATDSDGNDYIKWVDFDVSYDALDKALQVDIETFNQDLHISWINILAYLGTRYGGNFHQYKDSDVDIFVEKLQEGSSVEDLTKDMKYFSYYYEAYSSVLSGLIGLDKEGNYGLTAYSPIASGYWYNDCDDFGNGRDYGFKRKHLGHDMFTSVGTPVTAVEKGWVEALGWNQYGGWRVGIRSLDGKRYYYYAHLRKDAPYASGLKEGSLVQAGQLIGYTGQSGYSIKENVNNINVPHLHFGMQLIFDESQKECNSEIWIDPYAIIRLLSRHKADVSKETQAASLSVSTENDANNSVEVPILMYHGLTDKPSHINTYFISVTTFEDDLKYLKENGYTAVTITDLISFVDGGRLPTKPVVITFDDGYCNNYNFATPLLKKYNMKAVISIIGSACEVASVASYRSEDYCNVTWEQIKEMSDSNLWEIQNHAYDLHSIKNGRKGASKKNGENESAYESILSKDINTLQNKITEVTGTPPNTFTWPFGEVTEDAHQLLKDLGFKATLSCYGGINTLKKGDTESLYLMKRNIRTPDGSLKKLLE